MKRESVGPREELRLSQVFNLPPITTKYILNQILKRNLRLLSQRLTKFTAVEVADIHGTDFYVLDCIDSRFGSGDLLQQVTTQDCLYISIPDSGGYRRTTDSLVDAYSRLH